MLGYASLDKEPLQDLKRRLLLGAPSGEETGGSDLSRSIASLTTRTEALKLSSAVKYHLRANRLVPRSDHLRSCGLREEAGGGRERIIAADCQVTFQLIKELLDRIKREDDD